MKIQSYEFPHSSFLSVEKDLDLIVSKIFKNQRLLKMLYYPTKDCLSQPALNNEQKWTMVGDNQNIRIVPRIAINPDIKNYLLITFDTFAPNANNPQFRNNTIVFTIYCHQDCWFLKDFELRPYKIAAELDSMFCNKHLTGIGDLQFGGASYVKINEDYSGISVCYLAIHGGEDKYNMPNPRDEEQFIKDFNETFNND